MLTSYRPLRCNLCPDGLGRTADISCGDAWDQFKDDGDPGRSIALVRTAKGREIFQAARRAGYVSVRAVAADNVLRAQASLLARRRSLFGRLVAFRMLGVPVPKYKGFSLFRSWRETPSTDQLKSVLGTLRRILQHRWFRRRRSTAAFDSMSPARLNGRRSPSRISP
jgi:coenzyme F420 hydrogenase subunit beta